MSNTGLGVRHARLTPLAGCLAAALVLVCGHAGATGRPPQILPVGVATFDSVRSSDPSARPGWWKRPDPGDIARRWQPAPHALADIPAGSVVVQNCNDHGSGSLRQALANANSGDTIDLTQLSCSEITLTTGSITFTQSGITLQGPGSKYLSISGNDVYTPLVHTGLGRLYVDDLSIEHGMRDGGIYPGRGGCIYGDHVYVNDSVISSCTARTEDATYFYRAVGGGVFGYSSVSLYDSSVIDSSAVAPTSEAWGGGIATYGSASIAHSFIGGNYSTSRGGGAYAHDGLLVSYSTFDSNNAGTYCGAFCAAGEITIFDSAISNNQAISAVGGAELYVPYDSPPPTIVNSTISGNRSAFAGGIQIIRDNGIYGAHIANSTIAFNHEDASARHGAGLNLYGQAVTGFDLESTILSNNTYGPGSNADDVGGSASIVITGAGNLIGYSTLPVPSDTILGQDPLLAPLAFNGGATATHALLSGSPAIDAGNNTMSEAFDQRGSGYPRMIGSAPDIGAYELDTDDVIFVNGFET